MTLAATSPQLKPAEDEPPEKWLINSNVAIDYGRTTHSLGDETILLVQNANYGSRDDLPLDLWHKAGPITYRLAPDAAKDQIGADSGGAG